MDIIGVWQLVDSRATDKDGHPIAAPYGPVPTGLLGFYANGRMVAALCDGRPSLPAGETERAYTSYCGNYKLEGDTLTTRVDAAADPSRIGGDQVRRIRFDNGQLVLMPPLRPARGGKLEQREMFFAKVA